MVLLLLPVESASFNLEDSCKLLVVMCVCHRSQVQGAVYLHGASKNSPGA